MTCNRVKGMRDSKFPSKRTFSPWSNIELHVTVSILMVMAKIFCSVSLISVKFITCEVQRLTLALEWKCSVLILCYFYIVLFLHRDGFPVGQSGTLSKVYRLTPLLTNNRVRMPLETFLVRVRGYPSPESVYFYSQFYRVRTVLNSWKSLEICKGIFLTWKMSEE